MLVVLVNCYGLSSIRSLGKDSTTSDFLSGTVSGATEVLAF